MIYQNFEQVYDNVKSVGKKAKMAVAAAEDHHTLEAVLKAEEEGIVEPVLVGSREEIRSILAQLNKNPDHYQIHHADSFEEAATKSVALIHQKEADFLMKGKLETATMLKAVVDKENGLGTGRVMSHFVINKIPTYHKLLVTTDGGMMMYPTLEEKKSILENAVETLKKMGYEKPKVAVLAAVEKVNPKMQETLDADQLAKMNAAGEIKDCYVEGPLSFDIAFSKEMAELKGFKSQVAGDADVFIVPNITAGNILGKSLVNAAGAQMAGFIVGAKVPIVLTSRGSSAEEKYLSILMSAASV